MNEHSWVAVSIIIFIALIFKHLKRAFRVSLETREGFIRLKLEEAESLSEAAEKLLQEHLALHQNSDQEAKNIVSSAATEVERLKTNAEKEFTTKLQIKTSSILARISNNEAKLIEKMRLESVQLAINTSVIILRTSSQEVDSRLLDNSIDAIKNSFAELESAR
jgi:F-type H+-transporting ATPase subunit b